MLVLVLTLALADGGAKKAAYAKPALLAEPADLAAKAVVLDVRPRKEYAAGHVPGAVWVDLAAWGKAVTTDESRDGWVKRVGALGMLMCAVGILALVRRAPPGLRRER